MNEMQTNGRQYFYEMTQSENPNDIRRLQAAIQGANRGKVEILTDNFINVLLKPDDPRKECIKAWVEYKISKGGKEELKKVFDKTVSKEFKSTSEKAKSTNEKNYLKSTQYQIDEFSKSLSDVSVELKENKTTARDCLEAILTTNLLSGDLDIVIQDLNKLEMDLNTKNNVLKGLLIIKTLVSENNLTEDAVDLFMQIDIDNLILVFESLKDSSENTLAYEQIGLILNNCDTNSSIQIALPENDKKTTVRSLFKEIREQRELQRDLIQALKELKVTIQEDVKSQTLIKWEKEINDEVKKISLSKQFIPSQVAESKPVIQQPQNEQPQNHQPQIQDEDADLAAALAESLQQNEDLEMQQAMMESLKNEENSAFLSRNSSVESFSSLNDEELVAVDSFIKDNPLDSAIPPKAPKAKRSVWSRILAPFKWIAKPFIWFINLFRKNKI